MRKLNKISGILGMSLVATAMLGFAVAAHAAAPTQFDHYLCYKGALSKGEPKVVKPFPNKTLIDQFENRLYDVKSPKWHCNPVIKTYAGNTESPTFPDIHLEGYPIALTQQTPRQVEAKSSNRITVDQFGALKIVVKAPESLDVRTSKINLGPYPFPTCNLSANPPKTCFSGVCQPSTGPGFCLPTAAFPDPPANDDSVDNFKCYHIGLQAGSKFTPIIGQVSLGDEFWSPTDTFDIVRPTRLCAPVDKNGENPDAPGHPGHLVCYKIKLSRVMRPAVPDKFFKFKVADSNGNFADNRLDVTAVKELCVPATKITCGDGVVDSPYEDCDPPSTCSGGPKAGQPCTVGSTFCGTGGTCVPPLTSQCTGGTTCSADCHCQ